MPAIRVVAALAVGLVAACTLAVSIGSVRLPVVDVWSVVADHLGLPVHSPGRSTDTIVWVVRVPRVLLAVVVGAGLALVGAALQATVRNPIADPYLLGISSGAAVGRSRSSRSGPAPASGSGLSPERRSSAPPGQRRWSSCSRRGARCRPGASC